VAARVPASILSLLRGKNYVATLSYSDLEDLWVRAGGSVGAAPTAAAVAEAESGGNPRSTGEINTTPPDYSVGPWQINYYGSLMQPRSQRYGVPAALESNPLLDARAAVDLYNARVHAGQSGFEDWTTYNDQAYLAYMPGGSSYPGAAGGSGHTGPNSGSSSTMGGGLQSSVGGFPAPQDASLTSGITSDVAGSIKEFLWRMFELGAGIVLLYMAGKSAGARMNVGYPRTQAAPARPIDVNVTNRFQEEPGTGTYFGEVVDEGRDAPGVVVEAPEVVDAEWEDVNASEALEVRS